MKKFAFVIIALVVMVSLFAILPMGGAFDGKVEAAAESGETNQTETIEENENSNITAKAIAAAAVVAVVGAAGAIGMAIAISKSAESMARQPEMASKINSTMMLGIVFIETAIIYALIVAVLIIFVL